MWQEDREGIVCIAAPAGRAVDARAGVPQVQVRSQVRGGRGAGGARADAREVPRRARADDERKCGLRNRVFYVIRLSRGRRGARGRRARGAARAPPRARGRRRTCDASRDGRGFDVRGTRRVARCGRAEGRRRGRRARWISLLLSQCCLSAESCARCDAPHRPQLARAPGPAPPRRPPAPHTGHCLVSRVCTSRPRRPANRPACLHASTVPRVPRQPIHGSTCLSRLAQASSHDLCPPSPRHV